MKSPISLCLICRNDENTLEECLKSIYEYVTEIIIVDTGSTDGSPTIAKKYATRWELFTACNNPDTGLIEDFSKARQYAFSLATQPWVMWADADDVIVGAEKLKDIITIYDKNKGHARGAAFLFPYEYSYDENGKANCVHYRERLLTVDKFRWVNPVHEVLVPIDNAGILLTTNDDVIYKHRRQYFQKPVESGRNLRILRKYVEGEGANDARQLYYLGLECLNNGLIDEAITHLTKYINVSGWEDEKCMATLKLVDIFNLKNQLQDSLYWAFKTIEIKENWGEGYFALAKIFYCLAQRGGSDENRNWEKCIYFAKLGLSLPPTKTVLFVNPADRDIEIHRYLNVALNKVGKIREALDSVDTALKSKPNDPALSGNKKLYQSFLIKQKIMESINLLKDIGELEVSSHEDIICLINKQPLLNRVENIPVVKRINKDCLDIIFYAGQGVEDWSPVTINKNGIGGSELMMMEMSKRLSKLGHKVRVYNSCGSGGGVHDGVEYIPHDNYHNLSCDVLIVSRRADMLKDTYNISATLKLLWVHDVCAIGATNEVLLKADKILALSDWHKQNLINVHTIHPDHIIKTRNGIDLSRFAKNIQRDPFKCINSSSPDRSWPILLELWPRIKERVPQASLHLFYGFKNWMYSAQHDKLQMDLIYRLKNKIEELSKLDVTYYDRVNQYQLAEHFLSAGCLLHPTWFTETSGITFMEAQAAGLKIVSSAIGALTETVGDRGILLSGDWCSSTYHDNFVNATIDSLNTTDDRQFLQTYAKNNFCLDKLAKEWENMILSLIENKKVNPLNPYYPTQTYR